METTSHRPWEAERNNPQSSSTHGSQTLPSISTLTANMPGASSEKGALTAPSLSSSQRDSGSWSMPQSARSSSHSNTMPYLNSSHQSPTRRSGYTHEPPPSVQQQPQTLPPISLMDQSAQRGGGDHQDSRRSSVESRMHQGMEKMGLGPTSPYTSNNPSQTSLMSGLQRERGIQPNGSYRGPRYSAAGPLSPLGPRASDGRGFTAGRVAPPILENPRSEVYNAEAPTAGQAYAFPDPDAKPGRPPSNFSRRNSFAESYTSSLYTVDSRLPQGQQELPGSTHHHSLQHKQVQDLMDDPDSPNSTTPYSRTPELRVTHKLAERKRRSEMKDCFEALRQKLPPNQNNKSSKWETLTRAIDYINGVENQRDRYARRLEEQNHQLEALEAEVKDLRQRLAQPGSYQTPPGTIPHSQSPLGFGNHYENGTEPPRTLPPLMNGNVNAMQGVQYSDDRH